MSVDVKVALLGLLNAALMAAGSVFQKVHGIRTGSVATPSAWLLAALVCFTPTFFIGNLAYAIGGRISIFVPMSAAMYILVTVAGKIVFGEALATTQVLGCAFILAGVALIARA